MYEDVFLFFVALKTFIQKCVSLEKMSLQPQIFKKKLLVAGLFSKVMQN